VCVCVCVRALDLKCLSKTQRNNMSVQRQSKNKTDNIIDTLRSCGDTSSDLRLLNDLILRGPIASEQQLFVGFWTQCVNYFLKEYERKIKGIGGLTFACKFVFLTEICYITVPSVYIMQRYQTVTLISDHIQERRC